MQTVTIEQALQNAIASSAMEGLVPDNRDLELIRKFITGKMTHEEFLDHVKKSCQGA